MDEKKQFTFENGTVSYSVWYCDDIKLGHSVSKFTGCFNQPALSKNDVVRIHFGLKGAYQFSCKQLNKSFDLSSGHTNMMYSNGFDMLVHNKSLELETFGIQFPKQLFIQFIKDTTQPLEKFAQNVQLGKSGLYSEKWGPVNSAITRVIQEVTHCKYQGDIKKNFLLSKSIELLVLAAQACSLDPKDKEKAKKQQPDHEKLMAVKDLINSHVINPPSIIGLAKMVGMSEFNLKQGFIHHFNTTVFGYFTDQRLNLARQILLDTNKTTSELSEQLGYAKTQYFNAAFKKKFGITPHSIKQLPTLSARTVVQRSA